MTSFLSCLPGQLAAGGRGSTVLPVRAAAQTLGCRLIYNSSERAALSAPELIRISVIKGGADPTPLSSDLLKGTLEVARGSDCPPPPHLALLVGMMTVHVFVHSESLTECLP